MIARDSTGSPCIPRGILIFLALFLVGNAVISKIQKDRYWINGLRVEGLVVAVHTDTRSVNNVPRVVNEVIEFEYKIDDQVFDDSQSFYSDTAYFVGQRIPVMSEPVEPWTAKIILDDPFNLKIYAPLAFICGVVTLMGMRLYYRRAPYQKLKRKERLSD